MTYELNEDLTRFTRIDYGVLDWLADVGGLFKVIHLSIYLLIFQILRDGPSLYLTAMLV